MNLYLSHDGLPFVSNKPEGNLTEFKSLDPNEGGPSQSMFVRCDILDLSNPADVILYQKIWEGRGLGLVSVILELPQWIESKETWKVLIRWSIEHRIEKNELRNSKLSLAKELFKKPDGQEIKNDAASQTQPS